MTTSNVSNPVSAERLAEYDQKKREYNIKLYEEQAKLREKQQAEAKKAEAVQLGEKLAKGVTAFTTKEYKNETLAALDAYVNELKEDNIEGNELTDEQIKLAKKYIEGKEFKKARETQLANYANSTLVEDFADETDTTSARQVRNNVKNDYKAQIDQLNKDFKAVEKDYKAGKITKESFEAKKEEYNDEKDKLNLLKNHSKGANVFQKIFGKKKESNRVSDVVASLNNKEQVQSDLTSKDELTRSEAHMNRFSAELQAKIYASGFTTEQLIEIYENNGGYADATVNYSYNKGNDGQIGERKGLLSSLNANKKGYQFTEQDVKAIGEALGYEVENAINWGKVAGDAAKGMVIGAPAVIGIQNTAKATAGTGAATSVAKNTVVLPVGAAIGLTTGAVTSAVAQYRRVEDKAIPEDIYEGVTTYDEYCARLKDNTTEEGYQLGSQIAKFYDFGEKGFNIEQLEQALTKSAGTVEADKTPLNYDEARGLLIKLQRGEIKPTAPEKKEPPVEKTEEHVAIVTENKKAEVQNPGCPYEIKSGDNPYEIAIGKYGLKGDHKTAMKVARYIIKMAKDSDPNGKAIFWKVRTEINLPETIPGIVDKNGNPVTVNCQGTVNAGIVDENYKGASTGNSNDLGNKEVKWQEHQAYKMTKVNGELVRGEKIGESHLEIEGAQGEIDKYKKYNARDNHEIITVR